ncbi:hypothetical protein FIBSPDRAFT_859722, partial [Athelia psychrophila]
MQPFLSYPFSACGYACDSYVSLQVVLTSSVLVTATATNQYADFFRVLKGGGSRFGIITSDEVQALHVGTAVDKTWYGGTISPLSQPPTITFIPTDSHAGNVSPISSNQCFTYVSTFNSVASTIVTQLNAAGVPLVLGSTLLFYKGTQAQFNTVCAEFLAIPALVTSLSPLSYSDMSNILPPGDARTSA